MKDRIPVIELRNVRKEFQIGERKLVILHDLSFKIWSGEFVAIVGSSGSGKSTAMNMLGLLDVPTSGQVLIDGKDTSKMEDDMLAQIRNEKLGFVFQQFNLLGALDCSENVSLPLFFKQKAKKAEFEGNVDRLLEEVGLKDRKEHKPLEMSGGEQQRAAIARALVDDPEVILADEPTGNLDSKTSKLIMDMLKKLNKAGKTLIMITHDKEIADAASRVLNIKDGRLI